MNFARGIIIMRAAISYDGFKFRNPRKHMANFIE